MAMTAQVHGTRLIHIAQYTQSIISLLQVAIVSAIVISKLDVGQVSVESRIDYKGQINLIVHAQFCALPRFYLFAFLRHNHC